MKTIWCALALLLATPALAQEAAPPIAAPDPARLAAAKPVIDRLWPLGTYRRLMDGTMTKLMDSMMDQMFTMRAGDMLPEGEAKREAGDRSMAELAASADPHFRERTKIMTKVMFEEMLPLMDRIEPAIRDSMVRIYARKFTGAELGEMDRFFATPTGQAYSREWMLSFMDPEIMQGMQGFVPDLMKAMPGIMKKAEAATAHLPPPPPKRKTVDDD